MDQQLNPQSVGEHFEFDHNATWKEFKDAIDKLLAGNNISEDVPIWYIDVSYPSSFGAGVENGQLSINN